MQILPQRMRTPICCVTNLRELLSMHLHMVFCLEFRGIWRRVSNKCLFIYFCLSVLTQHQVTRMQRSQRMHGMLLTTTSSAQLTANISSHHTILFTETTNTKSDPHHYVCFSAASGYTKFIQISARRPMQVSYIQILIHP